MMTKEPKVEPAHLMLPAEDTFRILLMDEITHTDQFKAACKDVGHTVVAAHTIAEAYAFLNGKDHADVIVCAAYLEDESMFEFLRWVRNDPVHEKTMFMIIALEPGPTAKKLNESVENAGITLGANAFITMPTFDSVLLISEIKKLLPIVPALEVSRLEQKES